MEFTVANQVSLGDIVAFISTCVGVVVAAVTVQVKTSNLASRQKEDRDDTSDRFKILTSTVNSIQSRQNALDTELIKSMSELKLAMAKLEVRIAHRFNPTEELE